MPRAGLSKADVVRAGAHLADDGGFEWMIRFLDRGLRAEGG